MTLPSDLVSIVLLAYNNEQTIAQTVHSLLAQTYSNSELTVVLDETSKDATRANLESALAKLEGRFRLVRVRGLGRSAARNVGWRESLGEVVMFADGDDVYYSDYLEKAIHVLKSDPLVGCVCVTGTSLVDGSGFTCGYFELYSIIQKKLRERGVWRPSWAWMYRRRVLEETGGFDEELSQAEDKDLFIRATANGWRVGLVEGVNWLHRRPSNFVRYIKKAYLGGRRRIKFAAKHGQLMDVVRSTVPLLLLVISSPLWTTNIIGAVLVLSAISALVTRELIRVALLAWAHTQRKRFILVYPVFAVMGYVANALGSATGLAYGFLQFLVSLPHRASKNRK